MLEEENRNLKENARILSGWMLNALTYEELYYQDDNRDTSDKTEKFLAKKWQILSEEIKYGTRGDWIQQYLDDLKNDTLLEVLNFNRGVETVYK